MTSGTALLAIGCYTKKLGHVAGRGKGIHIVGLDRATGAMNSVRVVAGPRNPSYLAVSPDKRRLYAVEEVDEGDKSQFHTYALEAETGTLKLLGKHPSPGSFGCHVHVDEEMRHICVLSSRVRRRPQRRGILIRSSDLHVPVRVRHGPVHALRSLAPRGARKLSSPGGTFAFRADAPTGMRRGGKLGRVGTTLLLAFYAIIAAGPLLLVLNNAFRETRAIHTSPLGLPTLEGAENFITAWDRASFSTYFFNSVFVTAAALILGVGSSTLAGYALGRFKFRGRNVLSALFLAGMLLPIQLGVVPIFYLLRAMNLIDSPFGLILVYAAHTLPVSILLLSVFFRQLPDELEEAARLDGAKRFRIFYSVMLPLVKPALATVIVVQTAPIWNDFFYPLVLLRSQENYTLPVGLTAFMGQYQSDYGALFAALVIVSAPIITLFVLATKHVVAGLTAGVGK